MQVETILIESDSVINAIVELISVLNIRRLVVGISKSNLRYGSSPNDQVDYVTL